MATQWLLTVLIIGLVCTLQVGFGVWVGVYLTKRHSAGADEGMLASKLERAEQNEEDAKSLAAATQRLASLCASFEGVVPTSVTQEIERLIQLTAQLRDQLRATVAGYQQQLQSNQGGARPAVVSDSPSSAEQPPRLASASSPPGAILSSRELGMMTTNVNTESDDAMRRYSYDAQQFVAFLSGDRLPAARDFRAVWCHDLSRGGVSFVVDEKPKHDQLVITLGTAGRVFLRAKIVHQRGLYSEGKLRHLVGCKFTVRLNPSPYHWDPVSNRVTSASLAVS